MTIDFMLKSTGKWYSINPPTVMMPATDGGDCEMIVTSSLRSPKYATCIACPIVGVELRTEQEFKDDFTIVLDAINATEMSATVFVIKQALLRVCNKHIQQYGHIWIADSMMYVDCAVFILQAINNLSAEDCSDTYDDLADYIVGAMGDALKRPNSFF